MGMTTIKNRAKAMFSREATTRKITGVRLSPRARSRLASTLYSTMVGMPRKITTM